MSDTLRILVIDDDPDTRTTLGDILEAHGYVVDHAPSGAAAQRLAEEGGYDLVIVDLQLPDMSGLEVITHLERLLPRSDILLITGHASLDSAKEAVRSSTVGYMTKPIDIDELLATARRVVERKQLEETNRRLQQSLAEAKQQWELTFDAISDPIAIADQEGNLVRVNAAFSERFAAPYAELIGANDCAVIYGSASHSVGLAARRSALGGEPFVGESDRLALPGTYSIGCYPVTLDSGNAVIHTLRDVTEHRRAEEANQRLADQIQKVQRMESIGRLAGGIAHDFNNLLTVILGNLDLAERDASSTEPVLGYLAEARRASNRAAELTRQLVTFARQQETERSSLDLNGLLQELESLLRRTLGEDVQLKLRADSDLWPIEVDVPQMTQVILNLAANARDAMPDGGVLTIETGNRRLNHTGVGELPELAPGDYVELKVTDNGGGISEDIRPHLFEPFFTTKEVGEGSGLGLATCYGIVSKSGGTITVESSPQRGTTFRVLLPRTAAGLLPRAADLDERRRLIGSETVLLVEDDDDVRETILPGLRSFGYRVLEAEDGHEALDLLAQAALHIDLMVTDIVMPRINGFELTEQAGRLRPGLSVLLVSGYPDDALRRRRGFDEQYPWLQKPYTSGELAHTIRQILDGSATREADDPPAHPEAGGATR